MLMMGDGLGRTSRRLLQRRGASPNVEDLRVAFSLLERREGTEGRSRQETLVHLAQVSRGEARYVLNGIETAAPEMLSPEGVSDELNFHGTRFSI